MNNDNAVGNTSGNLLNGGLFCEYDGKIYFANPNDYNRLYVMNSDCTDIKSSMKTALHILMYVENTYTTLRITLIKVL